MTATIHKVVAGNGYQYYLHNVAANDNSDRGRSSLSDYYSAHGEAPGRWHGTGLAALDIESGAEVTEEQMKSLFGLGRHPNAAALEDAVYSRQINLGAKHKDAVRAADKASRLGNPFRVYDVVSEFRKRCGAAFREHNSMRGHDPTAAIRDDERARIRTRVAFDMFVDEYGRAPLDARELSGWVAKNSRPAGTAVAGFDITFSPVKSVSALWALAPRAVSEKVEAAHHAAVDDALAWLEQHAVFTRLGRNGVRQVDVDGLVSARFDHRDSRAGDPDLHTHVLIANRVRTLDGLWRTLDGAALYRAVVATSEIYNTRLEHHLERLVGVEFAPRPDTDPAKRPIREIIGIPLRLIEAWSRREAALTARLGELSAQFQQQFGREPTPVEVYKLAQQATLETRPVKHSLRSLAEQRASWRAEALRLLGGREAVAGVVAAALNPPQLPRVQVSPQWISATAQQVLDVVAEHRSTWREHNVRAETERQLRGQITAAEWEHVVDAVVTEALSPSRSIALGDPDIAAAPELATVPVPVRRRSGASVYVRVGDQVYTSAQALSVERQLIELSVQPGGRVLSPETVAEVVRAHNLASPDRPLNAGQAGVVTAFATSGMRVHTANAPAGSGKTTAMAVLTRAWHAEGGSVLGLAPTAAAAAVLGESIGARVETVDKVLDVLARHSPRPDNPAHERELPPALPQWILGIDADTLVIVDEHVKLGNHKRLKLLQFLAARGATIRCIGDDHQLASIEAGGAHADMADAAPEHTLTLTHVVRFAATGEATASVQLRDGDSAALGWYLDHGRIHAGHIGATHEDAYTAWATDHHAGRDTVMLAAPHEVVTALNARARADRLARNNAPAGPEVVLGDGLSASVGDMIRTRRNNPQLRLGDRDWVRNGYTWTVTGVHSDGSLTAVLRRSGGEHGESVRLPADYVGTHVRLGYAATIDSAQGITADTCHVALTGYETRQQFYVAMTRGVHANHAYVPTALDGSEGSFWSELAVFPRTAVEVLLRILDREGAQKSAHTQLRDTLDPFRRLGRAVDIYLDTIGVAAEHTLGPDGIARLDSAAERVYPRLTDAPAYPVLRQHLAVIAMTGRDPITALQDAASARELDTANDPAAVLVWRLDTTATGLGPLPWLPRLPHNLDHHPLAEHLHARRQIITDLATHITDQTTAWSPATAPLWARPLLSSGDQQLVAEVAVWRAGLHVPERDLRPTGAPRYTARERDHQNHLNNRVHDVLGDPDTATNRWAPLAERLERRLLRDPYWPTLADNIELAHRAGIDITTLLIAAANARSLPDEMPAAALWARLELEPSALDHPTAHGLHPDWLPDLYTVLGKHLVDRIVDAPAWPRLVVVVEHATDAGWTPSDVISAAHELLTAAQPSDAPGLRPDQITAALTWRIDALLHHTPTPTRSEPEPLVHKTEHDSNPEPPMPSPHEPEPPAPDTAQTTHDDHTSASTIDLPASLRNVARLFQSGAVTDAVTAFRQAASAATPDQRAIITAVADTLYHHHWVVARARLDWAAQQYPQHAALIQACTPTTDPGVYQPDTTTPEPRYRRDRRHEAAHSHREYRDHTRHSPSLSTAAMAARDLTDSYLDHNAAERPSPDQPLPDGIWNPHDTDPRTGHYSLDYDLAALPPIRTLPCVSCGIERRRADTTPPPPRHTDDGLCSDCRDDHRPGIPDHTLHPLEARCAYLADTYPPETALALLRRDWRALRDPAHRTTIENWIRHHPLTTEPDPNHPAPAHTATRADNPLLVLTDDELAERIASIELTLAIPETETALFAPPQHSPAHPEPDETTERHHAAQDAIRHARHATEQLHTTTRALNSVRSELAQARQEFADTPAYQRRKRHTLQRHIATLRAKQDTAERHHQRTREAHRDAHRHATHLAGPEPGWQKILTTEPTPTTTTPPAATRHAATEHDRIAHLHHELTQYQAEQHRRQALTPDQRADENQQRHHISSALDEPAFGSADDLFKDNQPDRGEGPDL